MLERETERVCVVCLPENVEKNRGWERERKKSALGEVGPQRHIYSGQTLLVCTSALARERAREEEKGGERERGWVGALGEGELK